MINYKNLILLITLIFISGCNISTANNNNATKEKEVIKVFADEIKPGNLKQHINFTAVLRGVTELDLYSENKGKVKKIYKNIGDYVKKGEIISCLDTEDIEFDMKLAEANLASAGIRYEVSKVKYKTTEQLYLKKSISRMDHIKSKSIMETDRTAFLKAKILVQKAKKELKNSELRSPVSGYIASVNIKENEILNKDEVYCTIIDYRTLIIETGVSEKDIKSLKKEQTVLIYKDKTEYAGKIKSAGIAPNESGVYPVKIELINNNLTLLPGMIVTGKINNRILPDAIYTEKRNLTEKHGRYYIYIINKHEKAELRRIYIKEFIEDYALIEKGLSKGNRIIISGNENLKENSSVSVINKNNPAKNK